ncbi:hypothetical protein PFICI_13582 [Pestalotiopsis fici W106-1]|uniref:C2H2-type domain-containing protein n=1 Tax=Pestalotiopsis fici (strain W106-1 / CGMCC3.15140) TaxID=1229662 RepID=W3WMK5_PESFW|nr:uncharacterized protein PFICI_13582 [Pestalotiopsis fici W106-1]ETS75098.1 hypothetical protein PFICI_13582 [Pestalotiopsis fici W106-1]
MSSAVRDQPRESAVREVATLGLPHTSQASAGVAPAMLQASTETVGEFRRERFDEIDLPKAKEFKPGKDRRFSCDKNKDLVGEFYKNKRSVDGNEICRKSYSTARDLKKHLRTHVFPVICPETDICDIRKAEQGDMREHLRVNHSDFALNHPEYGVDFGPFICPNCEKDYTRPDNLTKHLNKNVC